jgi:hypothetical protein
MSPSLYLTVVPLIRRKEQPVFNRRSRCSTFTLQPRIAAYTCSSTQAQGTSGTRVRSRMRGISITGRRRDGEIYGVLIKRLVAKRSHPTTAYYRCQICHDVPIGDHHRCTTYHPFRRAAITPPQLSNLNLMILLRA